MSGEGHGWFYPGEGGLGHPQATHMNPKLSLLVACLTTTVRSDPHIIVMTEASTAGFP
jgi:hypothetical protein